MNNNACGRGWPKRWRSRRAENITHSRLTPSLRKRAPCSHPFNSLAGFRIITRLVAPHNATFQPTILVCIFFTRKYIEICQTFACVLLYRYGRCLCALLTALTPAARFTPHSCPSIRALVISSTTGLYTESRPIANLRTYLLICYSTPYTLILVNGKLLDGNPMPFPRLLPTRRVPIYSVYVSCATRLLVK